MTQVISIDNKIAKDLLSLLNELKEQVTRLNEKLETAPPYGSDEWWEWSNKKALEEIKQGQGTVIRNKKELNQFLNSLKTAS